MGLLKTWWADSRGKVAVTLFVLWVAALIYQFRPEFVWYPLVALLTSISFDVSLRKVTHGDWHVSLSSMVTGLLVGLIVDPTRGIPLVVVASVLASLNKFFLRTQTGRHVFNPAAFGILTASLLFGRPVAWWAASLGVIPIIILTVGMVPVLWGLRRHMQSATFLLVYFFMILMSSNITSALRLTADGTVLLFALVMLPEPITSVVKGNWRYLWGVLVGVLVVLQQYLKIATVDPLLFALLGANIVGFIFVRNKPLTP